MYKIVNGEQVEMSAEEITSFDESRVASKPELIVGLKSTFNDELALGFTCAGNIKMQADADHIERLKSGHSLAGYAAEETMMIRDYDNASHSLPLVDVAAMIFELGINYRAKLVAYWAAVDALP